MSVPRNRLETYVKLSQMAPGLSAHRLLVKVVSKRSVAQGARAFEHVLVADDSGAMLLNAHGDLCDKLLVGHVVELHNASVKLINSRMRLTMNKWASVHSTLRTMPHAVQTEPNLSQIAYRQLSASK